MASIEERFTLMGCDNAPGQEVRQSADASFLKGEKLEGTRVDFSHGDVNAFPPTPGAIELFDKGFAEGATQAYTEYRGKLAIRDQLAAHLAEFTGAPVNADSEMILTPGTQGALFLAMGVNISAGDKVAIVEPDYFANRKLVVFFDGVPVPVPMDYFGAEGKCAGLDLGKLEEVFRSGVKLFLFSNPNNPTGVIYSHEEVVAIARLAQKYGVKVICDELYSRQVFDNRDYFHLRAEHLLDPDNLVTIIGPSKTESLSGFRLGVAFGSASMMRRMEKLQAVVSLRCAGYCQAAFGCWFNEPAGFMKERVAAHQAIRDDIVKTLGGCEGVRVRPSEAGSYLFPKLPKLTLSIGDFVKAARLQGNVILTPGTEFGAPYTDSFRINFSQDHKAAVQAIERVLALVDRYRA